MNTYSITDIGKERENNQDRYTNYFHSSFSLLVVADGMGGYQGGEVASQIATNSLQEYIITHKDEEDFDILLESAIQKANTDVYERAHTDNTLTSMGTTIVAVIVAEKSATIAHVGDSRCYLYHDEELQQITEDHSIVAKLIKQGVITEEEALHHPDRSTILRAVGIEENVEVDIDHVELEAGDWILLATDGLTTMLDHDEIEQSLKESEDSKEACEELVRLANKAGGFDNITVTVYEFEG